MTAISETSFDSDGITNFRDAGGQPTTAGGLVKHGVLYRSGQFDPSGEVASRLLTGLNVNVVYDLRSTQETEMHPHLLPETIQQRHLDVLRDSDDSIAVRLEDAFADIAFANEILRSYDIGGHYRSTYEQMITLPSARAAYRELFTGLATNDAPALFHCTAGKDRTGWAAASLLMLLGVDHDIIMEDYLLSSDPVVESFRPLIDKFADVGGDAELLKSIFRVEPSYLETAMATVEREFVSIEEYFAQALGIHDEMQLALRNRYIAL